MADTIEAIFRESAELKLRFLEGHREAIRSLVRILVERLKAGRKILLFGNGGSAADAQHLAAEFVNRFTKERKPLAAIALTTDTSILTAVANDRDFTEIFARQIEALGRPGDVAIGLSTSGRSRNVLRGIEMAKKLGLLTVGFTGEGGELARLVEFPFVVPSRSTPRIQEIHITLGHALCELVEAELLRREESL